MVQIYSQVLVLLQVIILESEDIIHLPEEIRKGRNNMVHGLKLPRKLFMRHSLQSRSLPEEVERELIRNPLALSGRKLKERFHIQYMPVNPLRV